MFRPGDIVTLKEPDIGEEKDVIFVCYTKLYDDEFDCVLIERYGMEKNSTFAFEALAPYSTRFDKVIIYQ